MEFFRIIDAKIVDYDIHTKLTLNKIEQFTNLFFPINKPEQNKLFTGSMWGEFTLCRDLIKGGVRFALLECPNALTWTVTTGYPPAKESIVVHLTINRTEKEKEFINEINEFLDDHIKCLENIFLKKPKNIALK